MFICLVIAPCGQMLQFTLLDIFQMSAEMYCRTLFGGTLTSKLKLSSSVLAITTPSAQCYKDNARG